MNKKFKNYAYSFYGKGGIYPLGVSKKVIFKAVDEYVAGAGSFYEGDSVDREKVRDLIISNYGGNFPGE